MGKRAKLASEAGKRASEPARGASAVAGRPSRGGGRNKTKRTEITTKQDTENEETYKRKNRYNNTK